MEGMNIEGAAVFCHRFGIAWYKALKAVERVDAKCAGSRSYRKASGESPGSIAARHAQNGHSEIPAKQGDQSRLLTRARWI